MAVVPLSHMDLYKALMEEDFPFPPEVVDVKLEMPIDGIFQLVYRVNLDNEDLERLGRALIRVAGGKI